MIESAESGWGRQSLLHPHARAAFWLALLLSPRRLLSHCKRRERERERERQSSHRQRLMAEETAERVSEQLTAKLLKLPQEPEYTDIKRYVYEWERECLC